MAFSFSRAITIDHTKVPNTDQANFPVLVSGTYAYLATVANGGSATNASGYDIGFYSDAALTAKLDWETEIYTATTGLVVYWVRIPSLSHTVDTVIYMAYGNAAITTDQSNPTGVWNSNYALVYHLGNGTTLSAADSTVNARNGTITGATATAGQIDGAALFGAVSTDQITSSYSSATAQRSYSVWAYRTGNGGASLGRIFDSGQESLFDNSGSYMQFQRGFSTTIGQWTFPLPSVSAWHKIDVIYDSGAAANTPAIYVDGSAVVVTTASTPVGTATTISAAYVYGNTASAIRNWAGRLDEARICNALLSADWIKTEYNNQSSPSTFYVVGVAVVPVSGSGRLLRASGLDGLGGVGSINFNPVL